jgi:hypothetical protein
MIQSKKNPEQKKSTQQLYLSTEIKEKVMMMISQDEKIQKKSSKKAVAMGTIS